MPRSSARWIVAIAVLRPSGDHGSQLLARLTPPKGKPPRAMREISNPVSPNTTVFTGDSSGRSCGIDTLSCPRQVLPGRPNSGPSLPELLLPDPQQGRD